LHLIRQNEVEITDIPIGQIADQYLATLSLMTESELEVAAEYLVMAATLAWIKSRMLLPPVAGDGEDEGVDPREELVARLLAYQQYKEASVELGERPLLGREVYTVQTPDPDPTPECERELEVSVVALVEAFRRVLSKAPAGPSIHEVASESVTVHERLLVVMEQLGRHGQMEFERIFGAEGALPSRTVLIATFLAILELVRIGAVRVYQGVDERGVPSGPIRLRPAPDSGPEADGSDGWRSKISELM
ncbi:MAG: segregation/condensation protein A, partial [Myxococcales bacterium]|nr:segregation/condensation protein A [Myxococcales bacterium]